MILTIISFIFVLGVLVFFHEFGHFITAKKSGIRVEEFALGFGPKLFSRKKGETVYSIRSIPLGGFCNMTGEFPPDEDASEEEKRIYEETKQMGRTFNQKSILKRFLVIFMGPFMNFLLAALIFIIIFATFGLPVEQSNSTVIGQIIPQMPAAEAGLQSGDEILAVNDIKTDKWQEMASILANSENENVTLKIKRNNDIFTVNVKPEYSEQDDKAVIGISSKIIRKDIGFFKAIEKGIEQTWYTFEAIILGVVRMIRQRTTAELGGPVMIASVVGQAARSGMEYLLNWMAIISINLGIINLFPFPALDGGRIIFILIEAIRGEALPPEKEGFVHMIGFALLMLLMVFIVYKDIINLLT